MISELRLSDLGVIADATIAFGPGLTAITGETGAGKTMLLTGIGLLLGERADPGAVRPGADHAAVEGRLLPTGQARSVAEDAGALFDDDELLVVRTVAAQGRSRAHLGGRSVPLGVLSDIGTRLVTVHGQSEQLRLRSTAQQRAALDAYAGPDQQQALAHLVQAHQQRRTLAGDLERWEADAATREQELQRLTAALNEIDALTPVAGELDQLRELAERLGNVETLVSAALTARSALDPDDGDGAVSRVEAARRALDAVGHHDPVLADLGSRVTEAMHLLNDVVTETGSYAANLQAEPAQLSATHERRAAITDLIRRHADPAAPDPLDSLLQFADHARARVAELTAPGASKQGLQQRLADAVEAESAAAAIVTTNRTAAAAGLSAQVDAELHGLGMKGAHLQVQLTPHLITAAGAEEVEFLLQPHPSAPARPLAKGASGGELSRIMLALELSLASRRTDDLPAFIFDEVDAGIGGRTATEVGQRLADLARHTQVIVVTHLAQVAAFADTHLVVAKSEPAGGVVVTSVAPVSGTQRESELARMLSGDESDTARAHAAELLNRGSKANVRP